jgi:hypothetical protein
MSRVVDNLIAFKILYMLVTPFEKTNAYKYGIIDNEGNALKKSKDLKTDAEKDSYTNLDRLVISLKKLLGKVPGGKSQLASIVAAYWLIKEAYTNKSSITKENLDYTINLIESKGITLVEEELEIEQFINMMEDGAIGIANTTGPATSTDQAAVRLNKKNKPISGIIGTPKYMIRRNTIKARNEKL